MCPFKTITSFKVYPKLNFAMQLLIALILLHDEIKYHYAMFLLHQTLICTFSITKTKPKKINK